MDSSGLKLSYSVDNKMKIKMKKDALEYVDLLQEYMKDPKYKTELCKSYTESNLCVYGNKCRFAHGKEELFQKAFNHPKYKIKRCISFFQYSYCSYGLRCHFQHEERNIRSTFRSYYSYLLNLLELNSENLENKENNTFFDEKENSPIEPDNRPQSPIITSNNIPLIKENLIYEKFNNKIKARRLAVFEKITDEKRLANYRFNEGKIFLTTNCFYPMF